MAVRVKLNSSGMAAMLKSAPVRAMLTERASGVLSSAKSSAPVDSGAYQASLMIVQDTTDRAAVRVTATVPYAMIVEANTGNLARALDAA